jgi:hypothetical protein
MNAILLPALLLVCAADNKPPAPKLPLGKDTTYVVGPLDKHGYIDYEAALNAELSKGITPEKNANALLMMVFGPAPEGGDGLPPIYFKWLDIPIPPKEGEYFIGLSTFTREQIRLTEAQMEALYNFQSRATQRVWVAKDCPPLAEWLKLNDKQLAMAIEAVKRPEYFSPLCSRRKEGESSNLIGVLLPGVQKCRELASALTSRAMLRLGEGKLDAAWQDILACHRLGRHLTYGATLIESLVGIAICQIASNSTLAYLERADLTSKQALERLKDLQSLRAVKPMADKIDLGERMMGLDGLQLIRRGGDLDGRGQKPSEEDVKALNMIDWTPAMQTMNKFYTRMATAMRIKDRAKREKELDKLETELEETVKKNRAANGEADLKKLIKDGGPAKVAGKQIGDVLIGLLAPAVRKVQQAHDRILQVQANLEVAFALTAYRKDTGRYPAKLADIAPKYLASVPGDLFAGKPLIYKPSEKGYLFYSIGVNGKDDGGRWYTDDPPGDDPGVKMPLPALKKN